MTASTPFANSLVAARLPRGVTWIVLGGSLLVTGVALYLIHLSQPGSSFNVVGTVVIGTIAFVILLFLLSYWVEGLRQARNRLATAAIGSAFIIALLPLISLLYTVLHKGLPRMLQPSFFTQSMRNVLGPGGGALHAIIGTLEITLTTTLISVPIGILTSIYLVEYGRGPLARTVTFMVDVMTGIPSIVVGLFTYAMFLLLTANPGYRSGFGGSIALSVIMIPIIVRASEEILRLVPNELREASLALGVPKWLTVLKVVIRTSIAGLATAVMLAVARVAGETAPLLLVTGFSMSMNYNLFANQMMTLPMFAYTQFANQGPNAADYLNRSWAAALTLILLVMTLNLIARIIARFFAPKLSR